MEQESSHYGLFTYHPWRNRRNDNIILRNVFLIIHFCDKKTVLEYNTEQLDKFLFGLEIYKTIYSTGCGTLGANIFTL